MKQSSVAKSASARDTRVENLKSRRHRPSIMQCAHTQELKSLQPPRLSQSVHREECTQCFDNQDGPQGVDVCLTCFNGGCLSDERHHARSHFEKNKNHIFSLNVRRKLKPSPDRPKDSEPPLKRLAVIEEREEDKYDYETSVRCWKCGGSIVPELSNDPNVTRLIAGVLESMSSARQSKVKAWEEELTHCEHTLTLQQAHAGAIPASGLAQCATCDLKENLWLCLTCGSLSCGRQQFGGLSGNGHALSHFESSGHPIAVKLGTITPEGGADIYCYACNDEKTDPDLATHLRSFGINVASQTKTEKSLVEWQIEQNLKFDFSLTGEDGRALQPVFGPGLTGLRNLGNSCYMASVVQTLFSLPPFRKRYDPAKTQHWITCTEPLPAACVECQMYKLSDGLLSGRYSHSSTPSHLDQTSAPVLQDGLKPSTFKELIGKGHEEFATMRQQDAEEFLAHLLKVLRQYSRRMNLPVESEPTEIFKFGMEQRLQCGECRRVSYRVDSQDSVSVPVPAKEKAVEQAEDGAKKGYEPLELTACLDILTGDEALEYQCPSCQKNVIATKRSRFSTFPSVLVVHAKKFQLVNWVPTKLDIPVILPASEELILDAYVGRGIQAGEENFPEDGSVPVQPPQYNQAALEQLQAMGFPEVRCQKALLATGNSDPEAAMNWLFKHMDDPDIDESISMRSGGTIAEQSPEQISMLADMGFTVAQARKALRETDGNMERAVEWLFSHPDDTGEEVQGAATSTAPSQSHPGGSSELPARYRLKAFISHKGPSVHSGHYVAHIRNLDSWVLFNDEKVVQADKESVRELMPLAYLYIFERL